MVAELHCHTSEHSACSYVNAVELITRAYDLGMQAIVITDHHYQWKDEDLAEIKKRAGLPDIFHVLAGQEFNTSDYGDVLVYGVKETIQKQKLTASQVRERYPEAAIIWAHPFRKNKIPADEQLLDPVFDAIEIFSSNYTVAESARALKAWHRLKFTAMAGTDTHALSYTGSYPTLFDHPFSSIEELVAEFKSGRCRPYFKEIPRSGTTDTKVMEVTIGPKTSNLRKEVIVKSYDDVEAWKQSERSHFVVKEIYNAGFDKGPFRVSQPLETDENNLSVIEERVGGETLYDKILKGNAEEAKKYLRMAAGWLAKLHNLNLKITPEQEYKGIEKERLDYYLSGMVEANHPNLYRAKMVMDEVWRNEQEIFNNHPGLLVQGHGDFHLKNIHIAEDENEEYAAVIDFDSSYQLPRAMDVGTFLAQYRNMFYDKPEVYHKAPGDIFLNEYLNRSSENNPDFLAQVELYKARAYLSIIYYLVKVGKGESDNFWTILVEAERSIAHMSFSRTFR